MRGKGTVAGAVGFLGAALLLTVLRGSVGAAALPDCTDVPGGPGVDEAPGGAGLPHLEGAAAAEAPAIAAAGDPTFGTETLVCAGEGLEGASLRVWAEGGVRDVQPLRTAHNRLVAVLPADLADSTLLVWPVGSAATGAPIRVNGATVWWGWPARLSVEQASGAQTVLLMGRNLKLTGAEPGVWVRGPGVSRWLTVTAAQPYRLEATLPAGLAAGRYELWAHNGTGGRYGWSEAVSLEVVAGPAAAGLAVYPVAEYGARSDDSRDDADAIQQAVDRAASAGGGIVRFGPGTYHVSRPITTPPRAGGGLHFEGAGMGRYDPAAQAFGGAFTAIRPTPDNHILTCVLQIQAPRSTLSELNLLNGTRGHTAGVHDPDDGSRQVTVRAEAHDLTFTRVRFVLLDERIVEPGARRVRTSIFEPALRLQAPGVANIRIEDCEFHSAGSGVGIGAMQRDHYAAGDPDPSTDYVRVLNCTFRGYSVGTDQSIASASLWKRSGILNDGITNLNGKNLIVEGCDFAGADRGRRLMMNRTILNYNTSIRQQFYLNNHSHDTGMRSPPPAGLSVNQGEQYLFHFRYPRGGFFGVTAADGASVTLSEPRTTEEASSDDEEVPLRADGTRAGSRILDEVGRNDHWIIFVTGGRGVGQYRVVTGADHGLAQTVLRVDRPWRVVPDDTSRVVLTAAFRQNIISGNTVDGGDSDPRSKMVGVLFWMNAVENIVAGNTFRNLGFGVGFNGMVRNPCAWNLVTGNAMENMRGPTGAESLGPAFYVEQFKLYSNRNPALVEGSEVQGWYSVGNLVRGNEGRGAPVAAYLHANLQFADPAGRWGYGDLRSDPDGGMVLEVMEGNRFADVEQGIVVNPAVTWGVVRNNLVSGAQGPLPETFDQAGGRTLEALISSDG
ncbi:MAG: hypothetical protein FJX74_13070 [Armatimonadetes bacterium]|nr:hypothetical protein [Armatimonadota bacterium]